MSHHRIERGRRQEHVRDAIPLDRLHDRFGIEGGQDGNGRAHGDGGHGHRAGGMGEGRRGEADGIVRRHQIADGLHERAPAAVHDADALCGARGAPGGDDGSEFIAIARRIAEIGRVGAVVRGEEIGEGWHVAVRPVEADQLADGRHLRLRPTGIRRKARMIEEPAGPDIGQISDVRIERIACVDRDPDRAGAPQAELRRQDRSMIGRHDRDRLLMAKTSLMHGPGEAVSEAVHLAVSDAAVAIDQDRSFRIEPDHLVEIIDAAHMPLRRFRLFSPIPARGGKAAFRRRLRSEMLGGRPAGMPGLRGAGGGRTFAAAPRDARIIR
ncbi:hypothetical protein HNP60_002109 [Sphingobium sp. B1D3A]|uniref:Uncharacterized protein n=1 Tax=Sphingobium lignivorans TaxID=2735886 RepID=A0ABR6NFU4_9SPHN|nr:hypothetical protein [Sphingobium lignivorans]